MGAAVKDVHHGHRQNPGIVAANITVQADTQSVGSGLGACQRNTQNGVGTQTALIGGSVQSNHEPVNFRLVQYVFTLQCLSNFAVHMIYSPADTLTKVTALITVTQFACFVNTGGSAGRYGGSSDDTVFQHYIHFHSGISAGIQDFSCQNVLNQKFLFHICNLLSVQDLFFRSVFL